MEKVYNRTWAEVDLDKIQRNADIISQNLSNNSKLIAVIKADAYGHGAVYVAQALRGKTDTFALSSLDEVLQLRHEGIQDEDMLILGYTPCECANILTENNITQTVFSYDYIKGLYSALSDSSKKLKVHVKLDTGMSRLGFPVQSEEDMKESVEMIAKAVSDFSDKIEFEGIFTHFAISDEPENEFTDIQFKRYSDTVSLLAEKGIEIPVKHTCNSAGVINYPQYHLSRCRPGIILYGMLPDKNTRDIGISPALTLKTVVSQTHKIKKGMTVSYGRTFCAEKDMTIATLPIGYADGFSRLLSNNGQVLIKGKRAQIIGRICMDQCIIDVTDIPDVKQADTVTLIGKDGDDEITATEIADRMGTINYEITCLIGKRVPRVYIKNGQRISSYSSILD